MFLTVGEKIKLCRKKYYLKQTAFEKYGISQYYLSLIENNKRKASDEILICIYNSFIILTNSRILLDYSISEFKKNDNEQAKEWLINQIESNDLHKHYEEFISVANKYNLEDVLYKIYYLLGCHHQNKRNYQKSNEFLQDAIKYGLKTDQNLIIIYKMMGFNLKMNMNYEGALAYYTTALNYLSESDNNQYFRLKYNIGLLECRIHNFDKALDYANDIIANCSSPEIQAGGILLKEKVLRELSFFEDGRNILKDYISNPIHPSFIAYAYHNLACNYKREKKYEDALKIAFTSLDKIGESSEVRNKTIVLIADIYVLQKKYEDGITFLDHIKHSILEEQDQRFIQWLYSIYIDLFLELRFNNKIIDITIEIKNTISKNKMSQNYLKEVQSKILNYVLKNNETSIYNELSLFLSNYDKI